LKEQELSLKDCIGVIKKRKKIILLVFLIAVIGSAVLSFVLPPVYEVKSTIKIGQIMDLSTFEKIPIESAVASAQSHSIAWQCWRYAHHTWPKFGSYFRAVVLSADGVP